MRLVFLHITSIISMFFDFPFGSNTLILAIWLVCLDFSGLVSLPCKKENKWAKLASVSSTANASLVFLAPKHLMVPPASGKSRVISWSYCGVVFLLLAEGLLVSLASLASAKRFSSSATRLLFTFLCWTRASKAAMFFRL